MSICLDGVCKNMSQSGQSSLMAQEALRAAWKRSEQGQDLCMDPGDRDHCSPHLWVAPHGAVF